MRQRLAQSLRQRPSHTRFITTTCPRCQADQAERYSEMLAFLKQRTNTLSTNLSARRNALQTRLSALSRELSRLSGYTDIERLKSDVDDHEKMLQTAREAATIAKEAYSTAVLSRANSQRETNDLLSRKNNWSSDDVSRFTQLVRQDHLNEQAEKDRKSDLDQAEETVDRSFTLLMRAILARYHEEQIWSDKIRSLSTYGSLAITGANVLIFLLAIIIVEPWRRRRLVERLENKMAIREEHILDKTYESMSLIMSKMDVLTSTMAPLTKPPEDIPSISTSSPVLIEDPSTEKPEILDKPLEAEVENGTAWSKFKYPQEKALKTARTIHIDQQTAITALVGFVIGATVTAIEASR